jgi:hypothetical protein
MRRCGIAAGLAGVAAWWVAYAMVEFLICLTFALPFAVMFLLDAVAGDRASKPALTVVPPAPPRQPLAVPPASRLAA